MHVDLTYGCVEAIVQCNHHQTKGKKIFQIMLGNIDTITNVASHWEETYIAHFIYIKPFTSKHYLQRRQVPVQFIKLILNLYN